MTLKRKILGNKGEDLALQYLENKSFRLIGQNIRLFCGEIDLLMEDGDSLVVVEVKTKSSIDFGLAADMITLKKKIKLLQLAKALSQKFPNRNIRIDVVAIDDGKVEHIVSAVEE